MVQIESLRYLAVCWCECSAGVIQVLSFTRTLFFPAGYSWILSGRVRTSIRRVFVVPCISAAVCCFLCECESCTAAPRPAFDLSLSWEISDKQAFASQRTHSWLSLCGRRLHTAAFRRFSLQPRFHTSSQLPPVSAPTHVSREKSICLTRNRWTSMLNSSPLP